MDEPNSTRTTFRGNRTDRGPEEKQECSSFPILLAKARTTVSKLYKRSYESLGSTDSKRVALVKSVVSPNQGTTVPTALMNSMTYKKHLQSDHWKKVKLRFYASKRFKDQCFKYKEKKERYHIHHKTYKWKGREKLQNLVALCGDCYYKVHFRSGVMLPLIPGTLNTRVYMR